MPPMPYIYLRGLRQVDHTVFNVANGQKTYRDPVFGRQVPYSSGQQVKHSILDQLSSDLGEPRAPVIFNWTLSRKKDADGKLEEGEAWSACDPKYADQLIGGWMKASKDAQAGVPVKRRSPLSISAMRPLHPTLAGVSSEQGTFDRSGEPGQHKIRVTDENGKEIQPEELLSILQANQRTLPLRKFLPDDQMGGRAEGLFVYDVAIDQRTLFSVSLNQFEPELTPETVAALKDAGWAENADKSRLVCPRARREEIIFALAHSLIEWRVTSNQSRTFSPQNTLAVAISRNANRIGAAIRAELVEEASHPRAVPVLEELEGASLYVALTARAYIADVSATANALQNAETELISRLSDYNYDE